MRSKILLTSLLTSTALISLSAITSAVTIEAVPSSNPDAFAGGVNLGTAGPNYYTILSLGGQGGNTHTDVTLNNQSTVQGNVGVAATGNISTTGNAFINGTLFLNSGGNWSHSGTSGAASFSQNSATDTKLNQAVQDALNASSSAASQPATQTVSGNAISLGDHGTQTINGTGQDVIDLTGFNLGNQAVLTLNAPAGSSFIFNISGNFATQGTVALSGGITPADVLFNITGNGSSIQFSGGGNQAQLSGILLSPSRDIQLSPGLINGEIIGGGSILTLTSGADAVPEASSTMLFCGGVVGLILVSVIRRRFTLQFAN